MQAFDFKLWGLPRLVSDHCPLILTEDCRNWGPRSFRFINAWCLIPNFLEVAEKAWKNTVVWGWTGFKLAVKLKSLKNSLKEWNAKEVGDLKTQLINAEEEMHKIDILAEGRVLSEEEKERRRKARMEMWKIGKMMDWLWLQKSRLNWALKGDKNTRFFHVYASSRNKRNLLNSVLVENEHIEEPSRMKEAVMQHFKKAFSEQWQGRPKLGGRFKSINGNEKAAKLEVEFSESEIWNAVKECDGNKAPGPDGFNLFAIKKCWGFIKGEVVQFFKEFHRSGKLVKGLNSSFIALIPKKENPGGLNDYRPISLINSIYKILAKVLSRRLRDILPDVVGEIQGAFIGGRNILDGVLIANEVVDWWKRSNRKGFLIKLDFEKAYDCINWQFVLDMLQNFGFGQRWIGWMRSCLSSARISILVNGSPTNEFSPTRGLRQGDPLSPFLFNVAAEALNVLIERAVQLGLVKGVEVGVDKTRVSHLQFADDTILFCDGNLEEVSNFKMILRCFEVMSGLRINFHKSLVCGVGVTEEILEGAATCLHCDSHQLPVKYLGLPLGASPRMLKSWTPVVEAFKKKLAGWKRKFLSFGGRVTLIKSVLSSLPVYYMSLFKIPEGVLRKLESIQASFLWGDTDLKRKVHLVNWGCVTLKKEQGGVGIRRLREMNVSLLLKWWWKFGVERNSLWKRIICSKSQDSMEGWMPVVESASKCSRVWQDIISIHHQHPMEFGFFKENLEIQLGNGSRIRFWQDAWIGDACLKAEFPRLYSLSINKDGFISNLWNVDEEGGKWVLLFRRTLFV